MAANTGGSNISNDSASAIRITNRGSAATASTARNSRAKPSAVTVAPSRANRSPAAPAWRSTASGASPRSRISSRHAGLTGYTASAITAIVYHAPAAGAQDRHAGLTAQDRYAGDSGW